MSPTYGSGAMPPSEMGSQGPDPVVQSMYNRFQVRGLFMHSHSGLHAQLAVPTHLDMAPTLLLL